MIGLGIVGLGVWVLLDDDRIFVLIEVGDFGSFDVVFFICMGVFVLIVSGGVVVLIGFLGCCGVVKENNCFLFVVGCLV